MNQLTWLFKRFPFSNPRTRAVLSMLLGGGLILGCQNLLQTPSSEVAEEKTSKQFAAVVRVYLQGSDKQATQVAEYDRTSCMNGFPALWSSNFQSSFGEHRFEFDFSNLIENKSPDLIVKTSQQRFQVRLDSLPAGLKSQQLCELARGTDSINIPYEGPAGKDIETILGSVAPDCQFASTQAGQLTCRLNPPTRKAVHAQLESVKRNMSTRWNHQPYLLIRRLTLTTQLLEALDTRENPKDLQNLCRILEFSLAHELPLSFRSKIWQEKVCRDPQADEELVMTGIYQAVREIEVLAKRIEDSSLVGLFTLSVPRTQSPAKEYWISLQPVDMPEEELRESTAATPCAWHPLFSDQPEKELIASELGQISSNGRSFCAPLPALARAKKEAANYIRSSMASEMEFQIANGQSKMLRLPTGEYKYSITQFNGPFAEEMFSTEELTPLSMGQVSWKNNRPRLVIKNW